MYLGLTLPPCRRIDSVNAVVTKSSNTRFISKENPVAEYAPREVVIEEFRKNQLGESQRRLVALIETGDGRRFGLPGAIDERDLVEKSPKAQQPLPCPHRHPREAH